MSSSIRVCVVCSMLAFGCSKQGASKAPENENNASSPTAMSATPTTEEEDNVAATLPPAGPTTASPGTDVPMKPQASWSEPSAPAAFAPPTANSEAKAAQAATQTPTLNDDQIAKITETVDAGEVALAKIAEKKATDKRVKKFAQHMVAQHSQDKEKVQSLSKRVQITPADSSVASDLEQHASRMKDELEQAPKDDFDRQYINAQVEGHQKVYDLLTSQLIPNATNADLKNRLEEARVMVGKHLNDAKAIQTSMASAQ